MGINLLKPGNHVKIISKTQFLSLTKHTASSSQALVNAVWGNINMYMSLLTVRIVTHKMLGKRPSFLLLK